VFLLYDSTPEFEGLKSDNGKLSHRKHFDLARFMRKVRFESPIAGTFFWVSQNPAEIPTMTTADYDHRSSPAYQHRRRSFRGAIARETKEG